MKHHECRTDAAGRPLEWEGGYIRYTKKGEARWYIERMVDGIRYHFQAGAGERNAFLELDRFNRDPAGYRFDHAAAAIKPIFLTAALRQEYLDYCAIPKPEGPENTQDWIKTKKRVLKWWQVRLVDERGRLLNLRRLPRGLIPTILDGQRDEQNPTRFAVEPSTNKRTRRVILKDFFTWLRVTKCLLTAADDPVLDLPAGQTKSSILGKGIPKDRVPAEHVKAVIALGLKQDSLYAHVLRVQAGTGGWHTTEMMRFVAGGSIELFEPDEFAEGCAAKLVCPKHKSGQELRTKVSQTVLDSARILLHRVDAPKICVIPNCDRPHFARHLCRKHYQSWQAGTLSAGGNAGKPVGCNGFYRGKGEVLGTFSRRHYERWVHDCCDELGIPRFNPSWMRHTNAHFALSQGRSAADVGARMGHAPNSKMVEKFYAPRAAPPKVPTILDEPVQPTPPNVQKLKRAPEALDHAKVVSQIEDLLAQLRQGETG